jgi:hypothetical protein
VRLLVTKKHGDRIGRALFRVWVVASVALTVVVLVMRVVNGPLHDSAWIAALVFVWSAPLLLMLLHFVLGWVWFVLWLLTRPFKRLRGVADPERWNFLD